LGIDLDQQHLHEALIENAGCATAFAGRYNQGGASYPASESNDLPRKGGIEKQLFGQVEQDSGDGGIIENAPREQTLFRKNG